MPDHSQILYHDQFITLHSNGILILHGYLPLRRIARKLSFSEIDTIMAATESPIAEAYMRQWGGAGTIWWTVDERRQSKLWREGSAAVNRRTIIVVPHGASQSIAASCENVREFLRQAQKLVLPRNYLN